MTMIVDVWSHIDTQCQHSNPYVPYYGGMDTLSNKNLFGVHQI